MKRVASLYLPSWSIDRLRRIERRCTPSAETDGRAAFHAIGADAAAERANQCSVPKAGGWRPGARWAKGHEQGNGLAQTRDEVEAAIKALPAHRRPPMRELGRTSEAAATPFRPESAREGLTRPAEERVAPPAMLKEMGRRTEAAQPIFRPGTRGWSDEDLQATVDGLPTHRRPSLQQLSRKTEVMDNPFRPMPADESGFVQRAIMPPLQFPGEDAPAKAGRGAALRDGTKRERYRNEVTSSQISTLSGPRKGAGGCSNLTPRPSARDGHAGEAGYVPPPNVAQSLKQLAAMPSVQFPGEGPHPDNHGRSEPTTPTYGQGRFFQTGRTLGSVVARVCRDEEHPAPANQGMEEPPLVTTHKVGSRVEVASANDAARALGIGPGTALTMARAQVPGLNVRDTDPGGDAAELAALAQMLARRWAPTVAIDGTDGLLIDLSGVAHLYGGEARFCRRLLRLLARNGVTARLAVASTPGAAWAIARFGMVGSAAIVSAAEQADVLAPLPVAALRLDSPSLELLARLGIDCIGQLAAMPRAPLVRRFGRAIADRMDQAMGRVSEPLDPVVLPTQVIVEQKFAEPIATPQAIEHVLRVLMDRLVVELARAGQGARLVEMAATRVDGVPQSLRLGFARATRDAAHMLRLTLRRIEEVEPGYGIDAIVLAVRRADPLGAEYLSPVLAQESETDLAPLIDALANRIGADRLWRAAPVESDVPERSWMRTTPLKILKKGPNALRTDDVRRLDRSTVHHPWRARWPRPVWLLRRPEHVDHVMALTPDQPPIRFRWRGTMHHVVWAEGPERVAGEWWRRPSERRTMRDYFRVEDAAGQRFWLFRRGDGVCLETGDLSWFIHGLGS